MSEETLARKLDQRIVEVYGGHGSVLEEPDKDCQAAAKAIRSLRSALMWTFDRLSVDGGMTPNEQRRTMREIGQVLIGLPSRASRYTPEEHDDSTRLALSATDREGVGGA